MVASPERDVMNVEFVGEPRRPANGASVFRIDARADGHPFVCSITDEAVGSLVRERPMTPDETVRLFRANEQQFRDAAATLLAGRDPLPAELKIRASDIGHAPAIR